jgi:hypothetical protein
MNITIKKLPSGFWSVWINGQWVNAALGSLDAAKAEANAIIEAENKRQNKRNQFTNIGLEILA